MFVTFCTIFKSSCYLFFFSFYFYVFLITGPPLITVFITLTGLSCINVIVLILLILLLLLLLLLSIPQRK